MWPPSSSNSHHYSQGQPQQQQQQPSSPSQQQQQQHHHHLQASTETYHAAAAAAAYGRYDGYDDLVNYENTELLQRMMVAAAVQQQQQQQQQQETLEEVMYQQQRQEVQHHQQQLFQQQQQEYSPAAINLEHHHTSLYPYHHITQPQAAEEEEEEEEMTSFPQEQMETVRTSTPPQSLQPPPPPTNQLNHHLQNQLDSNRNLQNEVEEKENEEEDEDEEENMMPYTGMIQSSPLVPSSNQHQYHGIVAASKELRQEQLLNENNKDEYEYEDEDEEDSRIAPSAPSPPMENQNMSTTIQPTPSVLETVSTPVNEPIITTNTPPKSTSSSKKKKKKPKTAVKNKKTLPTQSRIPSQDTSSQVILLESLKNTTAETTMTEAEYNNLCALMHQFCRVPLLAEFSRPISLLHPELVSVYSKVISHPCDLGKVCRAIRRKQYQTTRQVCLDVWRIFANCVKYHTHSITKEYGAAIPSFISIALHLRDYFNSLWQEFMIPSELTPEHISSGIPYNVNLYQARDVQRRERLNATCTTILSSKCLEKMADAIVTFLQLSGRVDHLDEESLLDKVDEDENDAVQAVFSELEQLIQTLRSQSEEYTMDMLDRDLKRCYSTHVFDDLPLLRQKIAIRLDRLVQKTVVPIHETNCRGVNQSSIWGCMAAAIWARESTKRPFWPALVMGILAPNDQKEDWHKALTDRNEARLPEKIRKDLSHGKKKALQTLAKQAEGQAERMSFFLVEFLGSHEFIWVREADILEHFDPNVDPNTGNKQSSKTKQAKHFIRALEEGRWALEEFELQLSDPCGDLTEESNAQNNDGGEHEIENYSFRVLCESDDEADEADVRNSTLSNSNKKNNSSSQVIQTPTGELSDIEEVHELLATDGLLDYSMEGRKNAKRRAQALKKHQADTKKKTASTTKKKKSISPKKTNTNVSTGTSNTPSSSKKKRTSPKSTPATTTSTTTTTPSSSKKMEREKYWEEKRIQKELEKRRKKRERERERCLREQERKEKRRKQLSDHGLNRTGRRLGINDKRGRAHSIVRGYLQRQQLRQNNGVNSMSAAGVEASGLLGMALAFRAAAGEISMPNDLDNASGFRPWERIQVSSSATSQERCNAYEEKIRLLQTTIDKFTKDDERRYNLIEDVKQQKINLLEKIFADEKEARKNVLPKKKRVIKNAKQTKQENTAKDDGDDDDEDDEKRETVNNSNTTNSKNKSGISKTSLNETVIQPQMESDSDDDGDDEEENEISSVKIANDDSGGDNDDEVEEEDDDNRGAYDLSENSQSSDSE